MTAAAEGTVLHARFEGFDRPFDVPAPDGTTIRLLPWTYADHMIALRDCVVAQPDGLALDREGFARRVLRRSGLDMSLVAALTPIALWWASGGDVELVGPAQDGSLNLGPTRAWLRPWTEGERLAALTRAMVRDEADGDWVDAVLYLDAMVRHTVVALDPPAAIDELDALAVARLLHGVVAINLPDPGRDPLLSGALPPATVETTLALCRRLGWTPEQVLAAPAGEIRRLIRLLSPAMPAAAQASGLTGHPDSVVIEFAEDES